MAIEISASVEAALRQPVKEPNIVLKIDGLDTVFGASIVRKFVRIGDGSEIGDPEINSLAYYIGGYNALEDQDNLITLDGTSTSIKQTLNTDKGEGSSISTLSVALIDDGFVSRLISPGVFFDDILQRKCLVYMGLGGAFPDDYTVIFRGVVTDLVSDAGKTVLQINHPDDKKRTNIFKRVETKTNNALLQFFTLDDVLAVVMLDSVVNFLQKIQGPNGSYDPAFFSYIKIDDELIQYDRIIEQSSLTATITIASPAVVTRVAHGLVNNEPITFSTTGALPTGLTVGTTYYVKNKTNDTFQVSLTPAGAAINTSGVQSGVHSIVLTPRLQGCVRGALSSIAASHDDDADVSSFYRLADNGVLLALKLMLSGDVDDLAERAVSSINVGDGTRVENSLYFKGIDVATEFGIVVGDYLDELSGSQFPANDVTQIEVLEIIRGDEGDFVVVDVALTDDSFIETDNEIFAQFRSQYSTLPDGCKMLPDEVDVAQHVELYNRFLNSVSYDFYLKEEIQSGKEFLDKEIYLPMGAYSLPRKARSSMGYHIGPIPGQSMPTFDETNIKMASKVQLKRSSNRNFYNEIVYRFDDDALEERFRSGFIVISEDSKNRIPGPNRTLMIDSKGMRSSLQGEVIALTHGLRRLRRYQYGAETLSFSVMFRDGYQVEIGDIILVDGSALFLPDTKLQTKGLAPRMYEVINKDFQLKTGDIKLEVMDTNFNGQGRYGLLSPASFVKEGISTTEFTIEASFRHKFGASEFKKWRSLKNCSVRVRSVDFSTSDDTTIVSATSNRIVVSPALSFVPTAGMLMEFTHYDDADVTQQQKLLYAFMKDTDFVDGGDQYQML